MSNRERWTVYPLLFLTLGIVLKDKLTKVLNADVVYCKTLVVTDRDQQERVVVSSNPAGGIVKVDSSNHQLNVLLGHVGNQHGVMYSDARGNLFQPGYMTRPPATQPPGQNPAAPSDASPANPENEPPGAEGQDLSPPVREEPQK